MCVKQLIRWRRMMKPVGLTLAHLMAYSLETLLQLTTILVIIVQLLCVPMSFSFCYVTALEYMMTRRYSISHCKSDETRFHKINPLNCKLCCRNGSFTGSQFDLSSTFRIAMMYARSWYNGLLYRNPTVPSIWMDIFWSLNLLTWIHLNYG